MEIDDLKKAWTKVNRDAGHPVYSVDEISKFRKARSKDFSAWIQNGLILDVALKGIFILAYILLIFLLKEYKGFILISTSIILLAGFLILVELKYLKNSKRLDKNDASVQDSIKAKLSFLKTYYYRIQFFQGLSNPMFVAAGIFYYYYAKYGQIRIDDLEDFIVILLLLVISFLFTLPTTLSLYGYHFRTLKSSLASLEDEGSWTKTILHYNRQKKVIFWIFGSLLFIGIVTLAYLILL